MKLQSAYQSTLSTPLGTIIAIADSNALFLLEFSDNKTLQKKLAALTKYLAITPGTNSIITQTQKELDEYFKGTRKMFTIPMQPMGTSFQKNVWVTLLTIPHGTTTSYANLAQAIAKPSASRAVANANAANKFAIITPCHRVIASDKTLGGYSGGLDRKQWLLQHEKTHL